MRRIARHRVDASGVKLRRFRKLRIRMQGKKRVNQWLIMTSSLSLGACSGCKLSVFVVVLY